MPTNLNTAGTPVHVGDRRRLWARFKDAEGALADPDAFTLAITEASGSPSVSSKADCVRYGVGEYYLDHTFSAAGRCKVTVAASGNIVEVEPGYVLVEAV